MSSSPTHEHRLPEGQRTGERMSLHANEAAFGKRPLLYHLLKILSGKISGFVQNFSFEGKHELKSSAVNHYRTYTSVQKPCEARDVQYVLRLCQTHVNSVVVMVLNCIVRCSCYFVHLMWIQKGRQHHEIQPLS